MMDAHSEVFQQPDLYFELNTVFCFALFLVNEILGCKSEPLGSVLGLTAILCTRHFITLNLTLCGTLYCF